MSDTAPRCPEGLDKAGKRLWKRLVVAELEYDPSELLLLEEAAKTADVLADLRAGAQSPKTLVEIRLQQEQLRKLIGAIRWPTEALGSSMSDWGRGLANRRWRKSG